MLNYYLNPLRAERRFVRAFYSPSFFNDDDFSALRTDIRETESEYLLDIELAGYAKEDVRISLEDGCLKVEASKHIDENKKYISKEIYHGNVSRYYYVGNIDRQLIKASFNNGILTISVPKEKMPVNEEEKMISID